MNKTLNNVIQKRFNKWLKRRLPATQEITLNSGNTFIFPSKIGLHFLITTSILFLLGTNYQNNLILFLVFFLCSFMLTCLLLSYQNLAGLTLKGIQAQAQFAGKDCQFKLILKQNKTIARDVSFAFQKCSSDLHTVIEQDSVAIYAFSKNRGYYQPGRVTLQSNFPFGLFTVWTHLDFDFKVLLYPQPIENKLQTQRLLDKTHDNNAYQSSIGVDQFSTLKAYQQGESLKSVAWKQLAQGRGWYSKQFEQSVGGDVLLDINSLSHLSLELRLSYLCYLVIELEKLQQRYALILDKASYEVGSGERHKQKNLKALALFELHLDSHKQSNQSGQK